MGPMSGVTFIYVVHVGHNTLADHNETKHREARCRRFLALMVGTLGSTTLAPHRGAAVDVYYVDGGRSRISVGTSQGGPPLMFVTLMVDAPRSPSAPPMGPSSTFLSVDGGRSRISSSVTSQGATMSSIFLSKSFFQVLALLRTWK
jgi:hypothetical protein